MVKVKSSVGKMTGKSGNISYFEVNGVTIGRSLPRKMGNPKTEAQMKQRIKMNNILNTYKYIKGYLQQNFEGIVGNKNAAGFFRSYNLMKTPVWMTKSQKESYKFILAPYEATRRVPHPSVHINVITKKHTPITRLQIDIYFFGILYCNLKFRY